MICPAEGEIVEKEVDRILTQYRESPNLIGLLRAYVGQVEEALLSLCSLPTFFDIETAVGDQLTLIGKRMGWPRCHCVCEVAPVHGFKCDTPSNVVLTGFCEGGSWINCANVGNGELCFDDDTVYRGYLFARRYQILGLYDIASLQEAVRAIWGEKATAASNRVGYVTISPGRFLNEEEMVQLPVAFRVLPIAPGIKGMVSLGVGLIAGFGEGWGGFCPVVSGTEILTDDDEEVLTDDALDPLYGDIYDQSFWLCPIDPHPYDCA